MLYDPAAPPGVTNSPGLDPIWAIADEPVVAITSLAAGGLLTFGIGGSGPVATGLRESLFERGDFEDLVTFLPFCMNWLEILECEEPSHLAAVGALLDLSGSIFANEVAKYVEEGTPIFGGT